MRLALVLAALLATGGTAALADLVPPGPRSVPTEIRIDYGVLQTSAPDVYLVEKNDTLSEIAERELGSVKHLAELRSWNTRIEPKKIRPGQRIFLPPAATAKPQFRLYVYAPRGDASGGLRRALPDQTLRGALRLVAVPVANDAALLARLEAAPDLRDAIESAPGDLGLLLSEPLPGHVEIAEDGATPVVRLRYTISSAENGRLELEEMAWEPERAATEHSKRAPPPTWALVAVLAVVVLAAAMALRQRASGRSES